MSSTAPSSGDSSGGDAVSISSEEDLDVKPSIKRAPQAALKGLGGLIFAGNLEKKLCSWRRSRAAAAGEEAGGAAAAEGAGEEAGGAGEEAGGALKNKSSFTLLLCH